MIATTAWQLHQFDILQKCSLMLLENITDTREGVQIHTYIHWMGSSPDREFIHLPVPFHTNSRIQFLRFVHHFAADRKMPFGCVFFKVPATMGTFH